MSTGIVSPRPAFSGPLASAHTSFVLLALSTLPTPRRNRAVCKFVGAIGGFRQVWQTCWYVSRSQRCLPVDKTLAEATVSKYVKRAKTMMAAAVKDRLLPESPFARLRGGNEANTDRHRFIDGEMSAKVLAALPNNDWRVIFALARWGGLRCPSEVLTLRWSDVDWAANSLRIRSSKTGLRFCPMFREIRSVLADAFEAAPDGAEYCVLRYRGGDTNLGTQFKRYPENAGLVLCEKPFNNLRSTRRTELQERLPDHVVNSWMGHCGSAAAEHYLQVTAEHWAIAINLGSPTGSPHACHSRPS